MHFSSGFGTMARTGFCLATALFRRGAVFTALALGAWTSTVEAAEYRAFWVDAWGAGFLNQSQVDTLLGVPGTSTAGQIRDANCNAVFVQVRRNFDACYPSSMGEPFMSGLTPSTFNALQAMIAAAHDTTGGKKRIEVHAWIVTFRTSGGAVYTQHVGTPTGSLTNLDNYWPTRDDAGAETSDKAFDPGHPLVLQYLVNVCMDLVNNFDIDGIHYDYIRFTANNQGYNPTSIARFNDRYGLTGQPAPTDGLFKQWRRDQVTALVRQVYARIQKSKPSVKQSGSFVTWNPSPTASSRAAFQATRPYGEVYANNGVYSDWDGWVQEGIVDMAVPMTYYDWASLPNDYTRWMNFEKDRKGNRHMIVGPGTYHNNLDNAILELQMTRDASPAGNHADGFCGYSYRSPYYITWSPLVYGTWANFTARLVTDVTPTWADIPDMPWKSAPTNGHMMGTVTIAGTSAWADGATVRVNGPANRTNFVDGTGFYACIDLPPGSYTVTASKTGYRDSQATVSVAVGAVTGNMYEQNLVLVPDDGNFTLTVSATAGGTVTKDPDQPTYAPSSSVTLTATPNSGFAFTSWSGDASGTNNPLTVVMDADKTITASFVNTLTDIILDNTNAEVTFSGTWQTNTSSTDKYLADYRFASTAAGGTATARFRPSIGTPGLYNVSIWYPQGGNRATNAPWSVVYDGGSTNVPVDQTSGGGGWRLIAPSRPFQSGTNGYVQLSNDTGYSGKVVLADGVRFTYVGPLPAPQPGRFLSVEVLTDHRTRLVITGTPGASYVLQASADLTGWASLSTNFNTNGTFEVIDPATSELQRYYRTRN